MPADWLASATRCRCGAGSSPRGRCLCRSAALRVSIVRRAALRAEGRWAWWRFHPLHALPECRDMLQAFCPATGKPMGRTLSEVTRRRGGYRPCHRRRFVVDPAAQRVRRLPGGRAVVSSSAKEISDKYIVLRARREGGMGTVFEAEHRHRPLGRGEDPPSAAGAEEDAVRRSSRRAAMIESPTSARCTTSVSSRTGARISSWSARRQGRSPSSRAKAAFRSRTSTSSPGSSPGSRGGARRSGSFIATSAGETSSPRSASAARRRESLDFGVSKMISPMFRRRGRGDLMLTKPAW